ncbi:transposase [Spinactinospora alkalitolerans]|uniref:Transposase n=1 Tax=Spinactinospora alkalitolerans TaxID=687207 RepID=A0A852TX76_9ACTN|nr:transposase [Spinactinospora alkalitolerans]
MALPVRPMPRVPEVDDFALRKSHRYATVLTDAATNVRVDVLADRSADTSAAWLRDHPGVEVAVRDGAASYPEAVRRALPDALQVADRWHLWHDLSEAVAKEAAAHSGCWAKAGPPRQKLTRQET